MGNTDSMNAIFFDSHTYLSFIGYEFNIRCLSMFSLFAIVIALFRVGGLRANHLILDLHFQDKWIILSGRAQGSIKSHSLPGLVDHTIR